MDGRCTFGILSMHCTGSGLFTFAFVLALGVCVVMAFVLTVRLDWLLLHRHPDVHRDFSQGMAFSFLRKPDIEQRMRSLNDPQIYGLLTQTGRLERTVLIVFFCLAVSLFLGV